MGEGKGKEEEGNYARQAVQKLYRL